jgi:hypothetical protein
MTTTHDNRKLFFGPIAGIVESFFMLPFDTVKVLKQSNQYNQYNGFKYILKNNPKLLYKGFTPFTSQMFVKYGLRYNSFQFLKSETDVTYKNFIAGFSAGFIESIFITPFELIKTQLQTCEKNYENKPLNVIKTIVNKNGLRGLYRGFISTSLRQSINQGCNFSLYYNLRKKYIEEYEKPSIFKICSIVAVSSSVGPIITAPIDTIKTRYMNSKYHYKNIKEAFYHIYNTENIKGFYKGLGLRLIRVSGGQMITFIVIENLCYYTKI